MRFPDAIALAPAKVNLGLEVLGGRSDGYHEIATILQTVSIFDRFEWFDTASRFAYESPLGVDPESDLVAVALARHADTGRWSGRLRLVKDTPIAAGFGGGSADAALALALAQPESNRMELESIASGLGSDVPFFIRGGASLATGTGTTLHDLPSFDAWFVIVTPPVSVHEKTSQMYGSLTEDDYSDGGTVRSAASRMTDGDRPGPCFPNAFTRALREIREVRAAWHALKMAGGNVNVSGAGPTLFAVTTSYREAAAIAARISPDAGRTRVACTLPAWWQASGVRRLASRVRGA